MNKKNIIYELEYKDLEPIVGGLNLSNLLGT